MVPDNKELSDALGLSKAFERATKCFHLCPNRVWAVVGTDLPKLIPKDGPTQADLDGNKELQSHEMCTYQFCEYSQQDFTAVQQRHECKRGDCSPLEGLFQREVLKKAAEAEESTVWSLDGQSTIQPPSPYMAISHVWSDGTGAGAWRDGEVNECLYQFFKRIAIQFQCDGIWWDTLCIPQAKVARNKAIRKIQSNYENARITLVHDLFLRNWSWNQENACFAILMSPWFSRGWTALELAKSRKVKVIFKGANGPVMEDLDEEILANENGKNSPRKEASWIIRKLRMGITTLNSLLTVLGPRHTSWAKDRCLISALLMDMKPSNAKNEIWQQDIYKRILIKLGTISTGHLFHDSATMSTLSWCPTNLFDMSLVDEAESSLLVNEDLSLVGKWICVPVQSIPKTRYNWRGTHHFLRGQLQAHVQNPDNCCLLVECPVRSREKPQKNSSKQPEERNGEIPKEVPQEMLERKPKSSSATSVDRALLVKRKEKDDSLQCYSYLGAVYFHPPLTAENLDESEEKELKLLSGSNVVLQSNNKGSEEKRDPEPNPDDSKPDLPKLQLYDAIWKGDHKKFLNDIQADDLVTSDDLNQQPLQLAAERGDVFMIKKLLDVAKDTDNLTETILNAKCSIGQTALHRAAWAGSETSVRILLESGAEADSKDNDENSPLHLAAEKGFQSVAGLLINNSDIQIDCMAQNRYGVTSLHYAAWSGQEAIFNWLLDKGASFEAKDKYGWTPMHYAAESGQENMIDLFIGRGANMDIQDDHVGWTPMHFAAMNGHQSVVKLLRSKDVTIKSDEFGWTPRRFAEVKGHSEVVSLLPVEDSTKVGDKKLLNELANEYWSPLHCASINEPQVTVKELLSLLGEFGSVRGKNWNALSWAAKRGQKAVVQMLLDKETDIDRRDEDGRTSLALAAKNGHLSIVKMLLDTNNVEVNSSDKVGRTPLSLAAEYGHDTVVKFLIEAGKARVDARDKELRTPLSWASEYGHEAVVKRLLASRQVEVNSKDKGGRTPISRAAQYGHDRVVKRLLSSDLIDADSRDKRGQTALSWAAEYGHEAVVKRLLADGNVTVDSRDKQGRTPLSWASEYGHTGVVKRLVSRADVDSKDRNGRTALSWATQYGHAAVIELLISKGQANIDLKHNEGQTPLSLARKNAKEAVINLLSRPPSDLEHQLDREVDEKDISASQSNSKSYIYM